MVKRIRTLTFRVLCEIAGKICTCCYRVAHAASHVEEWSAQRRDRP
jgi:hypothetical protein